MKKSVKNHGRLAALALAALMVLGMVLSSAAAPSSVFLRPDAAEEEPESLKQPLKLKQKQIFLANKQCFAEV